MHILEKRFHNWLVAKGLSEKTIYDYETRVQRIYDKYRCSDWDEFANQVMSILYSDENLSPNQKSALKNFNEFLYESDVPRALVVGDRIIHHSVEPEPFYVLTKLRAATKNKPAVFGDNVKPRRLWFSLTEVAKTLQISRQTLTRWANVGKGPKRRKGCGINGQPSAQGRVEYHKHDINEFVAKAFPKKIY